MVDRQLVYAPSGDPTNVYTFDNVSGTTVYDEIGSNDLTITDVAKSGIITSGRYNDCFSHTGADGHSQLSLVSYQAWESISLWAKFPTLGTKIYDVLNVASGPLLERKADNILYLLSISTGYTLTDTDYHHIVFVQVPATTNIQVYIDNALEATIDSAAYAFDEIYSFGNTVNVVNLQSPDLDIIHVYDYPLSASDVQILYRIEGGSVPLPIFEVAATGSIDMVASAAVELPIFEAAGTASINLPADGAVVLPLFEVGAACGKAANADIVLPLFAVASVTGAYANIELPIFEVSATSPHATKHAAGGVSLPRFTISSTGYAWIVGSAAVDIPLFRVSGTGTHQARLSGAVALPFFGVAGSAVVGHDGAVVLPLFEVLAYSPYTKTYEVLEYDRSAVR